MKEYKLPIEYNWELAHEKITPPTPGGGVWGTITGTLSDQSDLQAALNAKQDSLGYTPYNATNPAGYIDSSALIPLETTLTAQVNLNTLAIQPLITLPAGLYIVEKGYLSGASIDITGLPVADLNVSNSGIVIPSGTTSGILLSSTEPGPCGPGGCDDILRYLYIPQNYFAMYNVAGACWPPPCNGFYTITGGETLNVQLTTAAGVPATVNLHIVIRKIG